MHVQAPPSTNRSNLLILAKENREVVIILASMERHMQVYLVRDVVRRIIARGSVGMQQG